MNPSSSPSWKAKHAWREIDRAEPPKRPAAERVSDFREIYGGFDEATVREQASRCIQCPYPTCVQACPLDSPIPELLSLVADGRFKDASAAVAFRPLASAPLEIDIATSLTFLR